MDNTVIIALITFIQTLITSIGVIFLKYYLDKNNSPHNLEKTIQGNSILKNKVEEIKKTLNASRVSIWNFHNGEKYYSGEPKQKMTMIVEAIGERQRSSINTFQNISVHLMHRSLSNLLDKDLYIETNDHVFNDDVYNLDKIYDINTFCYFKIITYPKKNFFTKFNNKNKGLWIGLLYVAFENKRELSSEEITYIKTNLNGISENLKFYVKNH